MKQPRLRLLIPVAFLLTLVAPGLRVLPGGEYLPDLWLLLFLWSMPDPTGLPLRKPIMLIVILGALRASVTALTPFSAWAGLSVALLLRVHLQRLLVDARFVARFLVGWVASLPLLFFDVQAAWRLGISPDLGVWLVRSLWVGFLWALALRPARVPIYVEGPPIARRVRGAELGK